MTTQEFLAAISPEERELLAGFIGQLSAQQTVQLTIDTFGISSTSSVLMMLDALQHHVQLGGVERLPQEVLDYVRAGLGRAPRGSWAADTPLIPLLPFGGEQLRLARRAGARAAQPTREAPGVFAACLSFFGRFDARPQEDQWI